MAAGGWKIFTAGDVLTADDTMDYLQQGVLVFASSGARGSAIAAPAEGQFSYLKDTDATEYYDGAAWTPVAQGGLVHIVTETFSAVSSVSLDNCFTGDYDNYSVVASFAASGGANMYLRLRAAGSDATTGYQSRISNLSATYGTSVSTTYFYIGDARTAEAGFSAIVFRPQLAVNTALLSHSIDPNGASIKSDMQGGYLANTTAYDGFTFYPNTGTITGVISVYGFKK